jgi:plasmid stabilization system protein ParE
MGKQIVWTEQARADIRSIEQPIALRILKTLARYAKTLARYAEAGEGNTKQLQGVEPPLIRLRAQDHRVFFRDKGEYLEISRVLDRKEAYR